MRGVLAVYLRRHVATRTALLTLFFVALMQVLELMDVTTDILDRNLGVRGLAYYAGLRTPSELALALPLAALLGAMWAFHDLARNHEMIAIRTADGMPGPAPARKGAFAGEAGLAPARPGR